MFMENHNQNNKKKRSAFQPFWEPRLLEVRNYDSHILQRAHE